MEKRVLLLLILTALSVSATGDWIFNTDEIEANVLIDSEMGIESLSPDYSVDYLRVNLTFFPRDTDFQQVKSFYTEPQATTRDDALIYEFRKPQAGTKTISLNSTVRSQSRLFRVKQKVDFPIEYPDELDIYTLPREMIDSDNPQIIEQANQIAAGEDDLMVLLHSIASWIDENVEYEYDTGTEVARYSKKASWVLKNRIGVCDEYTGLFIAMVRSLGIPARYVSGVAYTNMLDINDWGPHAWAEVHVPGYGWLPYDVTYGQIGFVDASHIKLKESLDSDESAINYRWKYHDARLTTSSLDIKTALVSKGDELDPLVEVSIRPLKQEAGFGSYNLAELEVRNLRSYYTSTGIQLAETEELETEGKLGMTVLLRPFETKRYFWILKTSDDLDPNYIYTIPLYVQSTRNASSEKTFKATRSGPVYTREDIEMLRDSLDRKEKKTYTKDIGYDCSTAEDSYYTYETAQVTCTVRNSGTTSLEGLAACNDKECHELNLGIGKSEEVTFGIGFENPGVHDFIFTAGNDEVSTEDMLTIDVLDPPKIKIVEKQMTGEQDYGSNMTLSANLRKTSYSVPKDLKVVYSIGSTELSVMQAREITVDQKYQLKLSTDMLPSTKNTVQFTVTYEDGNGKEYELHDEFEININNISLTQRFVLLLNRIELWFQGLF